MSVKILKSFGFEVLDTKDGESQDGPVGTIEGYASTFGNVDLGGDVIEQGAFTKTINETKGVWPILLDHNPSTPVGWNVEAVEDKKGLKTKSEILLITDEAKNRYELAKRAAKYKTKMGMSIGFSLVKWEYDKEGQVRKIKEVKMWEHSLVTFPMNPKATVSAVKNLSDDQVQKLIEMLKKAGYSLKEINSALGLVALDQGNDSAADPESDPELLQSLAKLTATIRGQ
jgi:HK97 family phage prohead protease